MKKSILIIALILSVLVVQAQDYLINFSGTGASTSVETVTVENLTQGKSITISGSQTLHLVETATSITPMFEYMDYPLIVYPNPSSGDLIIKFENRKSGMVNVSVIDISGREIKRLQQRVESGYQSFKAEGLSTGIYTVQVLLEDQKFAKKFVCNGKSNSALTLSYLGSTGINQNNFSLKNASTEQAWQYNSGDRLKFLGTSDKYNTIVMDVPARSKTISFNFIECSDEDGNNYPIVQIGDQWWMAENLKTTKYNDGTDIPNITSSTEWSNDTIGAYCWYNNDLNNKNPFGALYNGYVVRTNKLAPRGWHVATNKEWEDLFAFVGGDQEIRIKLRETGLTHWKHSIISSTNEYGFSALPAGFRGYNSWVSDGTFESLFYETMWWTKTEFDKTNNGYINDNEFDVFRSPSHVNSGYSVRCVIEGLPVISTVTISNVTTNSAESGGIILEDGGFPITSCGICWSTNPNPTISDHRTNDFDGRETFTSILSNLNLVTRYYVRAYAVNEIGVSYGNELSFQTIDPNITSITLKLDNDSLEMGLSTYAHYEVFDKNGEKIPNIFVPLTSSNTKIAEINDDGKITTEYDGEIYIKAVYNNLVDSIKLVVTPDFNNWKTFFEPVPDAFPDLNSYYEEVGGNVFSIVLTRVDLNKDGRTDLVFHLSHLRDEDDNLTIPFDAPIKNRLVALVSQPDGTFKDQTAELFGTPIVDLAGGAAAKVATADLNFDGYPDWVYTLTREDGRPMDGSGYVNTPQVAVLSKGDGTYKTLTLGDRFASWDVQILPMYDGSFHISFWNYEYVFLNGTFINVSQTPEGCIAKLAYCTESETIPNNLMVSTYDSPNKLKLFKRSDIQQNWTEKAVFNWPSYRQIAFIGWTGDTDIVSIISSNDKEYIAGGFNEIVELELYPGSAPIQIVLFSTRFIPERTQGRDTINSSETAAWNKLMAFEAKDVILNEIDIISDPEGPYDIDFIDANDVNHDGYEDLISYPHIQGAKPRVYLNNHEGKLILLNENRFPNLNVNENYRSVFADIDGDGIYDLIIWPSNGCYANTIATRFILYKGRRNLK